MFSHHDSRFFHFCCPPNFIPSCWSSERDTVIHVFPPILRMSCRMFLQQILQKVVPFDLTIIYSSHIANNFHLWSWPWFYTFHVCPVYHLFTGKKGVGCPLIIMALCVGSYSLCGHFPRFLTFVFYFNVTISNSFTLPCYSLYSVFILKSHTNTHISDTRTHNIHFHLLFHSNYACRFCPCCAFFSL